MAFLSPLVLASCDDVQFVEEVVLVNETDYPATVAVRGETGGWLSLTMVTSNSTATVEQVMDQGDRWRFRFSYSVHEPVEVTLTRQSLVDTGWRVNVPIEFEQRLRDEEVTPPP